LRKGIQHNIAPKYRSIWGWSNKYATISWMNISITLGFSKDWIPWFWGPFTIRESDLAIENPPFTEFMDLLVH